MLKEESHDPLQYRFCAEQNTAGPVRKCRSEAKYLLYASQLYTIRSFVLNNLGGAFLYSSLLKNDRNLVKIPVVPLIYQDIGLVWKKGKYLNNSS